MIHACCKLLKHHFSSRKPPRIYSKDASSLFSGMSDNLSTLSIST